MKAAAAAVALGTLLRQGYLRRRGVWTATSWRRFALLLLLALSISALSFRMAFGVDNGVYEGMTPFAHRLYFYTLMTLTIVGDGGSIALIIWFARGRPDRQLG